ncbi:MAG TPA: sulfatase-like hydrolase/transferase, partial [Pirellulales bacterium]|nr:sulfatase-like hydrolase/transferase [Pirellulales bacterium]
MHRAYPIWTGFLGLALLAAPWPSEARPPNVLFIAIDDLRPELGCYGAAKMHTPAIDKLASSATVFERAYCQQAVCNASRASLLSGCRPATTKVVANNVGLRMTMPDVVTLPQHFRQHGYHTASIGKIFHVEGSVTDDPLAWSEPSFEKPPGVKSWHTPESMEVIRRRGAELKAAGKKTDSKAARRGPPFEAADLPDTDYEDGALAERAVETLGRLKDQTFFLAVGFRKPHLPFCCPQKYFDLYPLQEIELPPNMFFPRGAPAAAGHDWYELRSYGSVPLEGPITEDMARRLTQGYRACVSFVDAQIGRVLAELDRLQLADDTIVVLWGDHGYHLAENGIWTKMTNFELGTRVPLIMRVPGKQGGQRTQAMVELVDIYPTLAECCGLPLPKQLEGTSFAPLLDAPQREWKSAVFSEYTRPKDIQGFSVRTDRYRYTQWQDSSGKSLGRELYDETADPAENVNVVDEGEQAERAAELARTLQAGWRAAVPPAPAAATVAPPKSAAPPKSQRSAAAKHDVLVVLCDQWSPRFLSWDNPQVRTPHLDTIAGEGMIFDACYTTSPVCMPARVSLITGLYPHNAGHELWGNSQSYHAPAESATMFQDIQQAGYTTAQIGKLHWHSGTDWKKEFNTLGEYYRALGLDYVLDVSGPPSSIAEKNPYTERLKQLGLLKALTTDMHERFLVWEYEPRASVVKPENYHDRFVTDKAVEFIRQQGADKPLCLVVSLHSPHPPLDAPGDFATMFDPQKLRLPGNVPESFTRDKRELEPAEVRRMLANYLGKIALADDCLGSLVDALKQRGTWDDALFIMTADHGEMMGSHGA